MVDNRKLSEILENTKIAQIQDEMVEPMTGACALGAILIERYNWDADFYPEKQDFYAKMFQRKFGWEVLDQIIYMNDTEEKSFMEIAAWLKTQGL
jgi:hypothetical protein